MSGRWWGISLARTGLSGLIAAGFVHDQAAYAWPVSLGVGLFVMGIWLLIRYATHRSRSRQAG